MQYAWIGKGYMVYLEKGEKRIPRFDSAQQMLSAMHN